MKKRIGDLTVEQLLKLYTENYCPSCYFQQSKMCNCVSCHDITDLEEFKDVVVEIKK